MTTTSGLTPTNLYACTTCGTVRAFEATEPKRPALEAMCYVCGGTMQTFRGLAIDFDRKLFMMVGNPTGRAT